MSNILDLFSTLEGWDGFPERLLMSPDEPIRKARLALNGQYDLKEALAEVSEQLRIFRQTWRAVRFEVIQSLNPGTDTSPEKFSRLGAELNQLAGLLYMRTGDLDAARYHLISALACDPKNLDTAFYLVEFYELAGEFRAAFDQLDKTFGDQDHFDRYFQLFRLCCSIKENSLHSAISCLEQLAAMPNSRQYSKLARHEADVLRELKQPLPAKQQIALLQQGMKSLENQDFEIAYNHFSTLLDENPMKGFFWYLTGEALSSIALSMEVVGDRDKKLRRERLLHTTQTLQTAIFLEPQIPRSYEVLIQCHMQLRNIGDALFYSQIGIKELPEDMTLKGLYARTLLYNEQREEAEAIARDVLATDPSETYSTDTMKVLLTS